VNRLTHFPGTPPWGDIVVWINHGALYSDIKVYQEYPEEMDFYQLVAKQDSWKARLLQGVYKEYNSDMRYFVEQKGMSPEMARSEIRPINDELFR
jgi:hypothetical protein